VDEEETLLLIAASETELDLVLADGDTVRDVACIPQRSVWRGQEPVKGIPCLPRDDPSDSGGCCPGKNAGQRHNEETNDCAVGVPS